MAVLRVGDRLYRPAQSIPLAEHHGVYVGRDRVLDIDKVRPGVARVRVVCLADFAAGRRVRVVPRPVRVRPEAVMRRARIALHRRHLRYSALGWKGLNCEHVATWVQTGNKRSEQAKIGNATLALAGVLLIVKLASDE